MSPETSTNPSQSGEPAEAPLDLQIALRLINEAEAKAREDLRGSSTGIYIVWAVAWIVGYGSLHGSRYGWLALDVGAALAIFGVSILAALAITIVLVTRQQRGIRGHSSFVGAVYGGAWTLGFVAMAALSGTVVAAVPDFWLRSMLMNGISVLIVGLMYMTGGAMFNDRNQAFLGIWFLVVTIAAGIAGPAHFLTVYAVLGPAGFIAGAVADSVRRRKLRQRNQG